MVNLIKISTDKRTGEVIYDYLQSNNMSDLCRFDIKENSRDLLIICNNQHKKYELPVRIGKIIDQLDIYRKFNNQNSVIPLAIGSLDINSGVFVKHCGKQIYLTEKEVAIIICLYESKGSAISREELLKSIWGYVDSVETHTLETHIYRLRQKIEDNPSQPNIIITDGDGYKICKI